MSNEIAIRYQEVAPTFDSLAHHDGTGEWWSARELQEPAGYTNWRNWRKDLGRGHVSLVNTLGVSAAQEHFDSSVKSSPMPNGGFREVEDFRLSRLGAYIAVMNGDPNKPEIAAAQLYFAVRTRQAELMTSTSAPQALNMESVVRSLADTEQVSGFDILPNGTIKVRKRRPSRTPMGMPVENEGAYAEWPVPVPEPDLFTYQKKVGIKLINGWPYCGNNYQHRMFTFKTPNGTTGFRCSIPGGRGCGTVLEDHVISKRQELREKGLAA